MARKKRINYVGQLGVRYGKRIRDRVSAAKADLRRSHECQNCGFQTVDRVSVALWKCRKCDFTFAGAAYSPSSEMGETARRSVERRA